MALIDLITINKDCSAQNRASQSRSDVSARDTYPTGSSTWL